MEKHEYPLGNPRTYGIHREDRKIEVHGSKVKCAWRPKFQRKTERKHVLSDYVPTGYENK
jgi:hypothetical protein